MRNTCDGMTSIADIYATDTGVSMKESNQVGARRNEYEEGHTVSYTYNARMNLHLHLKEIKLHVRVRLRFVGFNIIFNLHCVSQMIILVTAVVHAWNFEHHIHIKLKCSNQSSSPAQNFWRY